MSKAPWFPFYAGDFLASPDVQLMEAHEVGAYLLLLLHSWQSDTPGYLADDEGRLRRAARLNAAQWADSRELLLSKWPAQEGGRRCNPRLLAEYEKQVELRGLKAEAGRKSAARREAARAAATGGQQSGNTNPTPVGNTATGVGENANYSQSQSQSQSSNDDERAGGQSDSASPLSAAPGGRSAGGPARAVPADAAPVFTIAGFREFVKSIGYGHIDAPTYLLQIQRKAEKLPPRPNSRPTGSREASWEDFIENYLNNDKRNQCLLLPEGQPTGDPSRHAVVPPTRANYNLQELAAAQAKPSY